MEPEKLAKLKAMLKAAGSAADGVLLAFGKGGDPIARKIAQDPALMETIFADLRGRCAEFYADLTDAEIDAITAFYSTDAGKKYNAATLESAPKIEGIVNGWAQDVLSHLARKN